MSGNARLRDAIFFFPEFGNKFLDGLQVQAAGELHSNDFPQLTI